MYPDTSEDGVITVIDTTLWNCSSDEKLKIVLNDMQLSLSNQNRGQHKTKSPFLNDVLCNRIKRTCGASKVYEYLREDIRSIGFERINEVDEELLCTIADFNGEELSLRKTLSFAHNTLTSWKRCLFRHANGSRCKGFE